MCALRVKWIAFFEQLNNSKSIKSTVSFPISGKIKYKKGDCSTHEKWYGAKCAICERYFMEVAFGSKPSILYIKRKP